jgi:serine/threonine protein kinase
MESLAGDDPAEIAGYRLGARLGAGGMGRVYLAFTAGGRPVALKVVRPELGDDPDFRARFRQEVTAARRVHGLYTAQVLDADPDASPPWLVTAYVPGPSLQQAVAGHGPLPADAVVLLMAGIAEALQVIHGAGLVHRDLKPSNVLLAADGPRVIDFGIARAADATSMTRTGIAIGSPGFMAPEQAEGLPVTPAVDVFALGAVAAYAALGRSPFGTGNDAAMLYRIVHRPADLDGCPPSVRDLIERCLVKAPDRRPSPAELIDECRARTAGHTLQIAQTWLPAAVSADLASHLPPAAPPAAPPSDPPTAPPPAAPPAAPPTVPPAVPRSVRPAPYEPTATVDSGRPRPGAAQRPDETRRRRVSRRTLITAAAALILAAGIGGGLAALLSQGSGAGHGTAANGGTDPTARSAASGPSASPSAALRRATATGTASARPSPSANPAACLTGTWRSVDQQFSASINDQQTLFTGSGAIATLRADGIGTTTYDNTVFSADVNGVEWTQTFNGQSTGHWSVRNGDILYSNVSSTGTVVLRDDGVVNNSGPLESAPGVTPYQCSATTLREYFTNGGDDELTRETAR